MSRLRLLGAGAILAVSGGGVAVASPAHATAPECDAGPKTVVTHLVNRPDNGQHGVWALDTFDRTVTIKKVEAIQPALRAAVATWSYQAVVADKGAFVTNGGTNLSPNKGVKLAAGVKGQMVGGFTVDFTAPKCFNGFKGNFDAKTYSDTAPTSTGKWVAEVWGGEGFHTDDPTANYSWTYTTCSQTWLEAYNNDDGKAAGAGDITGKPCASPSPSVPVTPTPTPTATATSSSAPVVVPVAQTGPPGASLPVTGAPAWSLAGLGALFIAVGLGGIAAARRRRARFTA